MKYILSEYFKKQLKTYVRKDPELIDNLEVAFESFNKNLSVSIGKGVYKIRVRSQNKGKSGGYRVYLLLVNLRGYIVPLCIYAKSFQNNINQVELEKHLSRTAAELSSLV